MKNIALEPSEHELEIHREDPEGGPEHALDVKQKKQDLKLSRKIFDDFYDSEFGRGVELLQYLEETEYIRKEEEEKRGEGFTLEELTEELFNFNHDEIGHSYLKFNQIWSLLVERMPICPGCSGE